eukprot:gene31148-35158_t
MTNEADNPNLLDPFETRVLAVLAEKEALTPDNYPMSGLPFLPARRAEKEALTPDNYPMSLNAITNGCNQLSSRDPVMSISEETVADVLQRLMQRKFVNGITQAGAEVFVAIAGAAPEFGLQHGVAPGGQELHLLVPLQLAAPLPWAAMHEHHHRQVLFPVLGQRQPGRQRQAVARLEPLQVHLCHVVGPDGRPGGANGGQLPGVAAVHHIDHRLLVRVAAHQQPWRCWTQRRRHEVDQAG